VEQELLTLPENLPKEESESANSKDGKHKKEKGQTTIYKTLHRKQKTKQYEP
jgi:hypothetical protein